MPKIDKQSPAPAPELVMTGTIADRIVPLSQYNAIDYMRVALYGLSGTGKTTFWATFPKPILAILCSGGLQPGELKSVDVPGEAEHIYPIAIKSSLDMMDLMPIIPQRGFQTVVLDHATGFQDLVLAEILGLSETPAQKTWGLATQQQYGQCTLQCKEHLRRLLGLPCHTVVVAQERVFKEDGAGSDLIKPTVGAGLTPSLTGWLNSAVDYLWQTMIRQRYETQEIVVNGPKGVKVTDHQLVAVPGKVDYCLRTAPDAVYMTKFRVPRGSKTALPDVVVDPSYVKLAQLIHEIRTNR